MGFLVADRLADSLVIFQPLSECIIYATSVLKVMCKTIPSVFSAYPPTEKHDKDDKDDFYGELGGVIANASKQDRPVLGGDVRLSSVKSLIIRIYKNKHSNNARHGDNIMYGKVLEEIEILTSFLDRVLFMERVQGKKRPLPQ